VVDTTGVTVVNLLRTHRVPLASALRFGTVRSSVAGVGGALQTVDSVVRCHALAGPGDGTSQLISDLNSALAEAQLRSANDE